MEAATAEPKTLIAQWDEPKELFGFSEQDVNDKWDLSERNGVAQVFRVDTRWFSAKRWAALIGNEIDGTEAEVWGNSGDFIITFSNKERGARRVRERVRGKLVFSLRSYDMLHYVQARVGDIDYVAKGKQENIAEAFESVGDFENATLEEIQDVPFMGVDLGKKVYERLQEPRFRDQ